MTVPPPGPLVDEAVKLAAALLGRVRAGAAADLPPELVARLSTAVADVAVAGAGLLRVVAEVATAWAEQAGGVPSASAAPPTGEPPVERIDIG